MTYLLFIHPKQMIVAEGIRTAGAIAVCVDDVTLNSALIGGCADDVDADGSADDADDVDDVDAGSRANDIDANNRCWFAFTCEQRFY